MSAEKGEARTMATTVRFLRDSDGFFCGVGFYDHARGADNPDVDSGSRVCSAMSVLASYVEVLAECATTPYRLDVRKEPPSRCVTWPVSFAMQTPTAALHRTVSALAVQYPEFVIVEEDVIKGEQTHEI